MPARTETKSKFRAQVMQLRLDETLLQPNVTIKTIDAVAHIDIDQSAFPRLQEIQVKGGGEAHAKSVGRKAESP